jgi:hypothetical protein
MVPERGVEPPTFALRRPSDHLSIAFYSNAELRLLAEFSIVETICENSLMKHPSLIFAFAGRTGCTPESQSAMADFERSAGAAGAQ